MSQQIHIARRGSKPWLRVLGMAVLSACLFVLFFAFIVSDNFFSKGLHDNPKAHYLQLVFVLQQITDTPAKEESIAIPEHIKRSDRAESFLHHSDKILVLHTIAAELDVFGKNKQDFPDAPLFAAYAHMALGEDAQARDLLMSYVVERDYQYRYYSILCRILEALADNESLLLITAEWKTRAPDCLQERMEYEWRARMKLGRYAEAKKLMLRDDTCMGGHALIYGAIAAQAEGQLAETQALLDAAKQKEDPRLVESLWQQQMYLINNR